MIFQARRTPPDSLGNSIPNTSVVLRLYLALRNPKFVLLWLGVVPATPAAAVTGRRRRWGPPATETGAHGLPSLLALIAMNLVVVVFGQPYQTLLPVVAERVFAARAGLGWLLAASGAGALTGADRRGEPLSTAAASRDGGPLNTTLLMATKIRRSRRFYGHPTLSGARMRSKTLATIAAATMLLSLGLTAAASPADTITTHTRPVLQLANPSAGDVVLNGDYVIQGIAYDPSNNDGAGVSRVDLFLGNRDEGGLFLGEAVPSADGIAGMHLAQDSFQLTVTMPNNANGGRNLFAYAITPAGDETVVSVPIYVGVGPAPTPRTITLTDNSPSSD